MTELLLQLGAGGIFALLIIREVLSFLSKRGNDSFPKANAKLGAQKA